MSSDSVGDPLSVIGAARRSLNKLVGERWHAIGRATDLIWLGFGANREVADIRGATREVHEYVLHVQCPFRVVDKKQLVVDSPDIYRPRPSWHGDGDFDWDVQGTNRFDSRVEKLAAHLAGEPVVLTSVEVAEWGDLKTCLSGGFQIDALRFGSAREEPSRFFQP